MRAADLYNSSIRLTDKQAKTDGMETAKKEFTEAATVSAEAVKILKIETRHDRVHFGTIRNA